MVTCWDHTTAVTEDCSALFREVRNFAWFHWSLLCQSSLEAVSGVSTGMGCPRPRLASGPTTTSQVLFQTQVRAAGQKPACKYPPSAGLQATLQWSCWAFTSRGIQPALLGGYGVCVQQHRASRAEQGYWISRYGEENCPSSCCPRLHQEVSSMWGASGNL